MRVRHRCSDRSWRWARGSRSPLNENAANANKYVDKFCEGAKKLHADHWAGGEPGTQTDAAAFMAPLMDYEKPLDDPPGKLHLSRSPQRLPPGLADADPIPNYASLLYWTRLRYALALRKGDLAQASSEVLHLANVIRAQALLIGDMIAVALLRQDAHMRASVLASGGDVSSWPAPDVNELQSYRQLDFASIYFT